MASPDFREYIDLTVNDLQPSEIYDLARNYALVSLPEFDPRVGTVEDAMLEAMSYVAGLVTGAVNRLPDGLMEGILRLMGFYRSEATFASGSVIFTAIDDSGLFIPVGTQVAYNETTDEGVVTHVYETLSSASIAEGDTESDPVQIVAIEAGEKPVISDGTALTILTPVARLFDATFDGAFVQGNNTESDLEFFSRAATYLSSLSLSLATAEQVTSYILTNYPEAYRVKAYDLTRLQQFLIQEIVFDGGDNLVHASCVPEVIGGNNYFDTFKYTGDGEEIFGVLESSTPWGASLTPGASVTAIRVSDTSEPDYDGIWAVSGIQDQYTLAPYVEYDYGVGTSTTLINYPSYSAKLEILDQVLLEADEALGSVTVFVCTSSGASLTAEDKAIIADDVRSRSVAGLTVYVSNVILAPITVSVEIKVRDGYSTLDVRTKVDDYLTSYLSPSEHPFSTLIRKNALISSISQIEGVEYVDSLTITSDDTDVATINGDGDVEFIFKGTLPTSAVTVVAVE